MLVVARRAIEIVTDEKILFKALLKGDVQERLREIDDAIDSLDYLKMRLAESAWSDFDSLAHTISTFWTCDNTKSPLGFCVYNHFEDRALDNCLFCHQPSERK